MSKNATLDLAYVTESQNIMRENGIADDRITEWRGEIANLYVRIPEPVAIAFRVFCAVRGISQRNAVLCAISQYMRDRQWNKAEK